MLNIQEKINVTCLHKTYIQSYKMRTWPVLWELHQFYENFTSFMTTWPVLWELHQFYENFTSFMTTSPVLWELHQFYDNLTSFMRTSPVLWQLDQFYDNLTSFMTTWPVLMQVQRMLTANTGMYLCSSSYYIFYYITWNKETDYNTEHICQ
jgi:GTP1/Obg family GTP-binding protein